MAVPEVPVRDRIADRMAEADAVRHYRAALARRRRRERSRVALAASRSRLLVGLTPGR
ncbi:MAG: hypothetical protein QOI76_2368 [Frankiales bacterium]|jgi:hypothetical protein|nr:hypothetical protein [Frankiales bacterium]